jgi:hypothetical protein
MYVIGKALYLDLEQQVRRYMHSVWQTLTFSNGTCDVRVLWVTLDSPGNYGNQGEISGSCGGEYEDNSSGLLRRVVWLKFTDVSKVLVNEHRPDDGGSKHL